MEIETIGQRIARLRNAKGWSLAELGRRMALAIKREKAFSGEAVRQYEAGLNGLGADARKALAAAFELSEQYIEFGKHDVAQQPAAEYRTVSERALDVARRFDQLTAACQEHVSHQIDLLAGASRNRDRDRAAQHDREIKDGAIQKGAARKGRKSRL